ncbi:MAG: esterase-like activity of phytase family protein [Phycisphaerales bacterium]
MPHRSRPLAPLHAGLAPTIIGAARVWAPRSSRSAPRRRRPRDDRDRRVQQLGHRRAERHRLPIGRRPGVACLRSRLGSFDPRVESGPTDDTPVEVLVVSDDRAEFDPARLGTLRSTSRTTASSPSGRCSGPPSPTSSAPGSPPTTSTPRASACPTERSSTGRARGARKSPSRPRSSSATTGPPRACRCRSSSSPTRPTRSNRPSACNNRGFEASPTRPSRSTTTSARRLYAGVEEPLAQDESPDHAVCRVLVYEPDPELIGGATRAPMIPARELLYPLGPVPDAWATADNGLSEMICVGPARILSLERAERVIDGHPHYNIRLYWVSTEGAADVLGHEGFGRTPASDLPPMMMKKLLLDFDDIASHLPGKRPMNFEGLALLPHNRLLVVSDNDHGEEGPTVFVLLQLPDGLDQ